MSKNDNPRPSMDLVPWEGCDKPIPEFLTLLPWAQSDDQAVLDIAQRILSAENVEQVLAKSETVEFSQLVGVVITVHGFRMMPSTIAEGVGAYAVIDFTYEGNETHQITTTSALGVLAQLARTWQLGGFPLTCAVLEIDTGKNGKNNPLYLGPKTAADAF